MAVFEDKVYWSERLTHQILAANKFNASDSHVVAELSDKVRGLHIYHNVLQRMGTVFAFICIEF